MSEPREFLDGRVILRAGDCRDILRGMADNSVDSVVTDPPYHLTSIVKRFGGENAKPVQSSRPTKIFENINAGAFRRLSKGFMGKQWDGGDIAFQPELWAEVLRVLKPGGYIMAFSGCRTYHRMACAIEDAGFITHPMFVWASGQGFPKARSVSKQIDREAGADREVVGESEYKKNRGAHRQSEYGFNGGDEFNITAPATEAAREWDGWFYGTQSCKPAVEPIGFFQKPFERGLNGAQNVLKWRVGAINVGGCKIGTSGGTIVDLDDGRWPANLLHDNSEEVLACFPESKAGIGNDERGTGGIWQKSSGVPCGPQYGDSGSAARFFASFPQDDVQRIFYTSKADSDDRLGSKHPTVKPLDLIQYLVRLITPKNGVCLDLFAGTGVTGEACFREGFRSILIELEAEYIKDIDRRMSLVMEGPDTRKYASMKARNRPRDDGPLFGGSGDIGIDRRSLNAVDGSLDSDRGVRKHKAGGYDEAAE
jgi:DNA modification methylase